MSFHDCLYNPYYCTKGNCYHGQCYGNLPLSISMIIMHDMTTIEMFDMLTNYALVKSDDYTIV